MAENASNNPCIACRWTHEQQSQCNYSSHVRLAHSTSNSGTWRIGSSMLLKERPHEGWVNEPRVLRFLSNQPDIPAPFIVHDWVDQGRHYMLRQHMGGAALKDAWGWLTEGQKRSLAAQVADVVRRMQTIASPSMQAVDGGPCVPQLLFTDAFPHGPFPSDRALWDDLQLTLACRSTYGKAFTGQALDKLQASFPRCAPYVLTHCDLSVENIVVNHGQLVGIVGWDRAAFYPFWYEYVAASWTLPGVDVEWKRLLREQLVPHDDAQSFVLDVYGLWE
ncbi:kinase-like protein [Aspergillus steynii IBT 23096]|uniref:Kinase-like protein n=1 Tax=Aspergillus steynii IBT 23096 TaxID=1392250 RepID=A0A2I2GBP2_9EURO|nr:kinase-like protein [Aspergillus steynii IBT 23096]PLB50302.1 kinase-like protein [Aspergillus steynii IBT 23096]